MQWASVGTVCPPALLHHGMPQGHTSRGGSCLAHRPHSYSPIPAAACPLLQAQAVSVYFRLLMESSGFYSGGNQENPDCWAAAAARCDFCRCFPNYAALVSQCRHAQTSTYCCCPSLTRSPPAWAGAGPCPRALWGLHQPREPCGTSRCRRNTAAPAAHPAPETALGRR